MPASSGKPNLSDVAIRLAGPSDLRICRMLLPETIEADREVNYAVGESGEFGRIVSAVAWAWPPGNNADVWRVAAHVILPFRNRGVEDMLLRFVADIGRSKHIRYFDHWHWLEADSEPERTQLALGFALHKTIYEFELIPAEIHQTLGPLLRKVRERGRIPDTARVVGLGEADLLAVAELHVSQLGGQAQDLLPMLQGRVSQHYDPYISTVLYVEDTVMGCNLYRWAGEDWGFQDATIVDPSLRNGWAMLWLAYEHARRGDEQGVKRGRFTTFVRENGDRLIGARATLKLLSQRAWLRRTLETDPEPGDTR